MHLESGLKAQAIMSYLAAVQMEVIQELDLTAALAAMLVSPGRVETASPSIPDVTGSWVGSFRSAVDRSEGDKPRQNPRYIYG